MLLSDNGSQMVVAARELREIVQALDSEQLHDYCAGRSIHWIFTTPAAPTRIDVLRHLLRVVNEL